MTRPCWSSDDSFPLSIAVISGGWSPEREVSLASGRSICEALARWGHDVCAVDPSEVDVLSYPWGNIDAAFIALHGPFGEDGTIQTILDEFAVPYTGSSAESSRRAISKSRSKQIWSEHGIPVPHGWVRTCDTPPRRASQQAESIGYPVIVKPDSQGSSLGISHVESPDQLASALEKADRLDSRTVVEQYIPGRELTVSLLNGEPLPIIEIETESAVFDYNLKYRQPAAHDVNPDLPVGLEQQVVSYSIKAAELLGCTGVCRLDWRIDSDQEPWLLELNTIPGFTERSLTPMAAAAAGITMSELADSLVRLAGPKRRMSLVA